MRGRSILLAVLVACGGRRDELPPIYESSATQASSTRARPVLRLLDAGESTGPHRAFRYDFDRVQPTQIRITVRPNRAGRTVETMLTLSTMKREPEGMRFVFKITSARALDDASMDEAAAADLAAALAKMVGLQGNAVISDRGGLSEFGWNLPPSVSFAAHQVLVDMGRLLRQLYPPVPEEEIGRNASWEVVTDYVTVEGFRSRASMTYRLTTFDERGFSLDLSATHETRPTAAAAAPEDGALVDSLGTGTGTVDVRWTPLATRAALRLSVEARYQQKDARRRIHVVRSASESTMATSFEVP